MSKCDFNKVALQLGFGKTKNEKLLEVIDRNLNFDDYVFTLCKKPGRKMSALTRISSYMSLVGKLFF